MNRRSGGRVAVLGLALTAALLVVATITGTASVGPLVFWAVHHTVDASGSTVALRPGLGLPVLWAALTAATVLSTRFQRRDDPPGQ